LFELRPTALEREGLAAALQVYVDHIARTTGWTGTVIAVGLDSEPSPDARVLLYRIAQEAIMNARKHASAGHVDIALATAGEGVTLRVADDGVGFDLEALATPEPGHLGLSTVVERAELAGGWARVQSAPGRGTTVECWLPVGQDLNQALG
jgi:signal transduction histidine kinase